MKLVRGQALTETIVVKGLGLVNQAYVLEEVSPDEWYDDIVYYLLTQRCPPYMNPSQGRALKYKSQRFMLQGAVLFR